MNPDIYNRPWEAKRQSAIQFAPKYKQKQMSKIEAIRFVNNCYAGVAMTSNFVQELLACTDDDKRFTASQIISSLTNEETF